MNMKLFDELREAGQFFVIEGEEIRIPCIKDTPQEVAPESFPPEFFEYFSVQQLAS